MAMENRGRTWGKFWTYALVAGLMLAGYAITWYLVEQRRDSDAEAFYKVSKANQEQVWSVIRYVQDMPDSREKSDLLEILSPVYIVRTRKEMDSLRKARDSTPALGGL